MLNRGGGRHGLPLGYEGFMISNGWDRDGIGGDPDGSDRHRIGSDRIGWDRIGWIGWIDGMVE